MAGPGKPKQGNAQPGQRQALAARTRYNREDAVEYARAYWDKTCSDGVMATTSPPKLVRAGAPISLATPASPFEFVNGVDNFEDGKPISLTEMEDCTHFTSCCIAQPLDTSTAKDKAELLATPRSKFPIAKAGGIPLQQQPGMNHPFLCGFVSAPKLVAELKTQWATVIGKEKMSREDADALIPELTRGDIIAYASHTKLGKPYEHCVFYLGEDAVACHTKSRFGTSWSKINPGELGVVTFLRIIY